MAVKENSFNVMQMDFPFHCYRFLDAKDRDCESFHFIFVFN